MKAGAMMVEVKAQIDLSPVIRAFREAADVLEEVQSRVNQGEGANGDDEND